MVFQLKSSCLRHDLVTCLFVFLFFMCTKYFLFKLIIKSSNCCVYVYIRLHINHERLKTAFYLFENTATYNTAQKTAALGWLQSPHLFQSQYFQKYFDVDSRTVIEHLKSSCC